MSYEFLITMKNDVRLIKEQRLQKTLTFACYAKL